MGAGSEINPTLHIVLQLSYIYILDEQSQTDLDGPQSARLQHIITAQLLAQHSRAQHSAAQAGDL